MSNSIYRRIKGNSYLAEQDSTTFLGLLGEMKKSEEFSVSSDKYAKKKKKKAIRNSPSSAEHWQKCDILTPPLYF